MTSFGRISKFDLAVDDWLVYTQIILKGVFATNDITEADRKRVILLSSVGADYWTSEV